MTKGMNQAMNEQEQREQAGIFWTLPPGTPIEVTIDGSWYPVTFVGLLVTEYGSLMGVMRATMAGPFVDTVHLSRLRVRQ